MDASKMKPGSTTDDVKPEEEEKCKEEKLFRDFSGYTTLHGFHFLLDSGYCFRRLFWTVLLVLMIILFFIQLTESFKRLNANDIILRKGVEIPSKIKFPAITICNQNMLQKSKIIGTDAQKFLDQLDDIKQTLLGAHSASNASVVLDMERIAMEKGHQLSRMLATCTYMGMPCTFKNFSTSTWITRGLCYTFNSKTNPATPGHIKAPGINRALTIQLDAQPEEYYGPYSYMATGFKIAVHDPNDILNMDHDSFDISPGFLTNIRVSRIKEISLPAPFASNCSKAKSYSVKACEHTCYSRIVVEKCKCRILGMMAENTTRWCSTKDITNCVGVLFNEISPSLCDCPIPCQYLRYMLQFSTAYFPSESLWDVLLPRFSKTNMTSNITTTAKSDEETKKSTQEFIRKRLCMVNIFFESLMTDVLEEKPAYNWSAFGSDLGGSMGLFLGCSILTICEFVDLMIMICLYGLKKRKGKEAKTPDDGTGTDGGP